MLVLQGDPGLVFWCEWDVASLFPEARGRWRAVHRDGSVGHFPGPAREGPWLPFGSGFVNPRWVRVEGDGVRDPAGFWWAGRVSGEVAERPDSGLVSGFDFSLDAVLSLHYAEGGCVWRTDDGDVFCPLPLKEAGALHSGLVRLSQVLWVNRERLRRVVPLGGRQFRLILDDGSELGASTRDEGELASRFGLASLTRLEPYDEGLARWGLRDFAYELALAPAARLRADFASAEALMAQQIWQAVRYRQLGEAREYGDRHRAFWYVPLAPTLHRGGWLEPEASPDRGEGQRLYGRFQEMLIEMVGRERLFGYAELGFADLDWHLRRIGTVHPEVVVYAEKGSLRAGLDAIGERFGVTTLVGSGQPELLQTEYLSRALRAVTEAPLRVVGYVDYDVSGWAAARAFGKQLEGLGHALAEPVHMLVREGNFTAEELELFALPCPSGTASQREAARRWVAEGGGVGGRPLGMHADHLKPVGRVIGAFERWFSR